MIRFKADDGYSYLIDIHADDEAHSQNSYRIDSEEINIQLGTNEHLHIYRLDISPEVSLKLKNIRASSI